MTANDDDDPRRDPRARANRSTADRLEMLETDTQGLAVNVNRLMKANSRFSPEQMEQLTAVIREELGNIGIRIDEDEQIDASREDFRFLRRTRLKWDSAANRVGSLVLAAIVGLVLLIGGMGFWA